MRMTRPLLIALGLLGMPALAVLSPATSAFAQDAGVFGAAGLVEILPAGDVIGDGTTPVTTYILARDASGQAASGLKLKVSASMGQSGELQEVGPGLYSFAWTPAAVDRPTTAQLEVKGRTADRVSINSSVSVPVRPRTATGLSVVSNPAQVVLGQDAEASISIQLTGAVGDVSASDLKVRTSVGEVSDLTHLGDGRFSARFVTPRVNFPQLALISVVDLRNPNRVFGAVAIPLQGKTDYPVQAAPGANVVLRIGGREYGPVTAKPTGRADVPIIVPPGVGKATKIEVNSGKTLEDEIDLRVPETPRLSLLPTLQTIPADGVTQVPVRVAVFTAAGEPDPSARVVFSATGGTIGASRSVGEGMFEADFTPAFSNTATSAELTVNLTGSSVQTDTLKLTLAPARPSSISLRPQPEVLRPGASGLRLFAKVVGPAGQGLDRRDLIFSVAGAKPKGSVEDLRNGDYRADFDASGNSNVDVVATVRTPATGNPLSHLLMFPQQSHVANDGTSVSRVTVVSVDELGYPKPNVEVKLKLETGDGTIQKSVKTNEGGVGQVYYTAGRGAGLVRVRASSGNRTGIAYLVQGPPVLQDLALPAPGAADELDLIEAWRDLVVPLRVPREGADGSTAAMETASGASGALARIQATSEPSTAAAGGRITLNVQASDAQGNGVAGLPFDLIVSQGQAGAVSDQGGGRYRTTVEVPPGAAGEVKVSVASGDTATFLRIPISGTASSDDAWGASDGTAAAAPGGGGGMVTPGPTGPQSSDVDDVDDVDMNTLRVRGALVGGSYRYQQIPIATTSPLLPATIAVGGDEGGSPATPIGGEVAVRGFVLDYVGFDANLRLTQWSLTAPEFGGQKVPDALASVRADAMARYPFAVGDNHFWVGARAGYHGSDVLYFTGSFEESRVQYQSLYVQGLGFGAELGGEIGDVYLHGALSGRLVGVNAWFATAVDAHVGYQLTDQFFVDAGFGYIDREVTLLGETSGADLGTIADRQLLFRLGGGVSF